MRLTANALSQHFRLLIVGGGSGGLGASHKFARVLPSGSIGVVEPLENHYYQPGFTLVGGGLMSLESNKRKENDLIHPNTVWIRQAANRFIPQENKIILSDGEEVSYDYMIVATGIVPRFDKIKGLSEALHTPGVCSNYSPQFCEKTFLEIQNYKSGNAIFTFPTGTVKCPGAPQKICYIADSLFRQAGKRDKGEIHYMTSLGKIFGVEKYKISLEKIAKDKNIKVNLGVNLIEVDSSLKKAKFAKLDAQQKPTGETFDMEYSLLHVGPPCTPIEPLLKCQPLTDANGYLDVNPITLQSKAFPNVFGVGDCMNTPNSKTAAAVSSHLKTIEKNLKAVMDGKEPQAQYDGYASCPLVVDTNKVILAEFNSNGPMETLPIDQSQPRFSSYLMKRYLMPFLYWHGLVKGYWNGPATLRKFFHFGILPKNK